jgi:hypothetical protein
VRSVPALLLPAIAGVLLLAGCAGPPPVDEAALHAWEKRQMATDSDRDAGAMFARVSPRDDAGDRPGTAITIEYAHPEMIDHLEFSCFGDGHMRGSFTVLSRSTTRSSGGELLSCSAGHQRIDLPRTWRSHVDRITFNAADSDRDSAWYVRVIATEPVED